MRLSRIGAIKKKLTKEDRDTLLCVHRTVDTLVVVAAVDAHAQSQQAGLCPDALTCLSRELLCSGAPLPQGGGHGVRTRSRASALLSTGIGTLDWMLGGGLATGEVTELVGMPGTGKTQLCLQACAAQAASAETSVLYVDSNGQFSAKRLYALLVASAQGDLSRAQCKSRLEERIKVVTSPDLPMLLEVLDNLDESLAYKKEASSTPCGPGADVIEGADSANHCAWYDGLRLIVLDSVFHPLLSEHIGIAGSLASSQSLRLRARIRQLARCHGIAVLVTNALAPTKSMAKMNDCRPLLPRPAFGHTWQGTAKIHVLVRKPHGTELGHDDQADQRDANDGYMSYVSVRACPFTVRPLQVDVEMCVKYALNGQVTSAHLAVPGPA